MQILSNWKLAVAAGVLFSVTAVMNVQAGATPTVGGTTSLLPAPVQMKTSPTLPPDPWTEPLPVFTSPTLPPDPWTEPIRS